MLPASTLSVPVAIISWPTSMPELVHCEPDPVTVSAPETMDKSPDNVAVAVLAITNSGRLSDQKPSISKLPWPGSKNPPAPLTVNVPSRNLNAPDSLLSNEPVVRLPPSRLRLPVDHSLVVSKTVTRPLSSRFSVPLPPAPELFPPINMFSELVH